MSLTSYYPWPTRLPSSTAITAIAAFQGAMVGVMVGERWGQATVLPIFHHHSEETGFSQFNRNLSPLGRILPLLLDYYGDRTAQAAAFPGSWAVAAGSGAAGSAPEGQGWQRWPSPQALALALEQVSGHPSSPVGVLAAIAPEPHPDLALALACHRATPHSWLLTVQRCWHQSAPVGGAGTPEAGSLVDRSRAVPLAAMVAGFALGRSAIPLGIQAQLPPAVHRAAIEDAGHCFRRWAGIQPSTAVPLPTLALHPRLLG